MTYHADSRARLALVSLAGAAALIACGNPTTAPGDTADNSGAAAIPTPTITVTDLGPGMLPYAVNASGTVVGSANGHAALWSHGQVTDLGTLGGYSVAYAISASGAVAGMSVTTSGEEHAFLWQHGVMTDLGTLGGDYSIANAVNSSGQVVGTSSTTTGVEHAFLWANGTMQDLGTLGGENSRANDINEAGEVVGSSEVMLPGGASDWHAFVWTGGGMTDLAADPVVGIQSEADAIAANGLIAGQDFGVPPYTGAYRLMFWRGTTVSFSGYSNDHLMVNDVALDGSVVGIAAGGPYVDGPLLWRSGTATILPPPEGAPPAEYGNATGIDPTGRFIVGLVLSENPSWGLHGILWTVSGGHAPVVAAR